MRHLITIVSIYALAQLAGNDGARAAEPAEYRQNDTNFYLPAAVLKAEPNAVILTPNEYTRKSDSYFVTLKRRKMPVHVYLEQTKDWLEPVTPPSMPASLGVAPDAMQIREPQGDVQVAPPNSTSFAPAIEGMPIANGSDVRTGAGGSAVVLFGGVNSVRLAPNSETMVQQTIQPALRSTRVDLKSGACFSKVGLRPGEKQDYEVHTPFGVAAARGTDFICVALPDRTDVWIAQGTVQFTQPNGNIVGTVKAIKNGLRIIRFPVVTDPAQANTDTSQTMTAALNFIPTVNNNLKTLRDQIAQGVKPTPQELRWMTYLKTVRALIKLDLVAPPPPPMPPATPPSTNNGAATMAGPQKFRLTSEPPPAPASNGAPILMPMMHASLSPREMSLEQPAPPIAKKKLARKKKLVKAKPVLLASGEHEMAVPSTTSAPATPPPVTNAPPPPPVVQSPAPTPASPPILAPAPIYAKAVKVDTTESTPPKLTAAQIAKAAKAKKKLAARQKKKKPVPAQVAAATKKPAAATTPKTTNVTPPPAEAEAKTKAKTKVTQPPAEAQAKAKAKTKAKSAIAKTKKTKTNVTPPPAEATPAVAKAKKPKKPASPATTPKPAPKAEIVAQPVVPAPAPAPPAAPSPDHALIIVAGDGSIHFEGRQLSSGRLERRLSQIAKLAPDCPVVVQGDRSSQPSRMATVIAMCHSAHLHNISIEPPGGGTPISTAPGDTQP